MAFETKRLTPFDTGLVAAGLVVFVSSFLSWRGATLKFRSLGISSVSVSRNAWGSGFLAWFGVLLCVAAAALWLAVRSGAFALPRAQVGPAVLTAGLAGLGTLFILIRLVTAFSGNTSVLGSSVSFSPRIGCYLGLLAGLVETALAVMLFRASGEPIPGRSGVTARGAGPAGGGSAGGPAAGPPGGAGPGPAAYGGGQGYPPPPPPEYGGSTGYGPSPAGGERSGASPAGGASPGGASPASWPPQQYGGAPEYEAARPPAGPGEYERGPAAPSRDVEPDMGAGGPGGGSHRTASEDPYPPQPPAGTGGQGGAGSAG